MKRKFFFISCARSDFDLINNLYSFFKINESFNSKLICCGSVISKEYGYTKSSLKKNDKNIVFIKSSLKKILLVTYFILAQIFLIILNQKNQKFVLF